MDEINNTDDAVEMTTITCNVPSVTCEQIRQLIAIMKMARDDAEVSRSLDGILGRRFKALGMMVAANL